MYWSKQEVPVAPVLPGGQQHRESINRILICDFGGN